MRILSGLILLAVGCFDAPPPPSDGGAAHAPAATAPAPPTEQAADAAEPGTARVHPPAPSDPTVAAMQAQPLRYTHHARCRMDCRNIDSDAVETILATGTLDPGRTRTDGACPSHALQGRSAGRELRVVFAACSDETRVVTTIDLDRSWDCDCP